MFKQPADAQSIQRQFQNTRALLITLIGNLSRIGDPVVSTAIQEISSITQSLANLEGSVNDHLKVRESQLEALTGVGRAINSSLGRKRVLEEVMDVLIKLMRAERGFLMLRDPKNGKLKPEILRGIDHVNLDEDAFKVSGTIVNKVVNTGEPILTTNAAEDPRFGNQESVAAYHLRSILCAPLKIKDELTGVIYVENRARTGIFRQSDRELINAFADQAAVAIDNARLIDDLRRSNIELEDANAKLESAYQATLEGWVRALDIRDKETEGHTQRVIILTERLARSMGVDGDALVHITRGALLHDIGKIGISDKILLKEDKLSDEERARMQEHPSMAYNILYPIEFLRQGLDIPYCHHEKWDGTGYPRKLKGEEIPFAARIFSVIDVWDALTNDRPYHKAWPQDEVREKIKADSGKHFDPRVVEAFMEMDDLSV